MIYKSLVRLSQIITKFLIVSSLKFISFLEVDCNQHLFVNNLKSFSMFCEYHVIFLRTVSGTRVCSASVYRHCGE